MSTPNAVSVGKIVNFSYTIIAFENRMRMLSCKKVYGHACSDLRHIVSKLRELKI